MKFKKAIAVILAVITVLCLFASCGSKGGSSTKNAPAKAAKLDLPDKKVVVLVAPADEYPEDYAAAQELKKAYPKTVEIKEYSDSRKLVAGDAEIIKLSEEAAADANVGAIIYARATEFTNYAINKAKLKNKDIITVAIEPEDKLSSVSGAASLVLTCDWEAAAKDMVNTAKAMGAEFFAFLSFDRHLDNELVQAQKGYFKAACDEAGLTYTEDKCFDPTRAEGFERAKLVAKERIAGLELNGRIVYGRTAVFCTDSVVQAAIAEFADEKGLILLSPNFPSAYGPAAEKYGIKLDDNWKNPSNLVKKLAAAIEENTEGKAVFGIYNKTLMRSFVFGAFYCAVDLLNGVEDAASSFAARLKSTSEDASFAAKAVEGYENVYAAYENGFSAIK